MECLTNITHKLVKRISPVLYQDELVQLLTKAPQINFKKSKQNLEQLSGLAPTDELFAIQLIGKCISPVKNTIQKSSK